MAIGFGAELGKAVESLPQLDALADEELPCDYGTQHTFGVRNHSGPGEWYIKMVCPDCGYAGKGQVILCCDAMKRYADAGGPFRCNGCKNNEVPGNKMMHVLERK